MPVVFVFAAGQAADFLPAVLQGGFFVEFGLDAFVDVLVGEAEDVVGLRFDFLEEEVGEESVLVGVEGVGGLGVVGGVEYDGVGAEVGFAFLFLEVDFAVGAEDGLAVAAVAVEAGENVEQKVQELVARFNEIGHVPFRDKDKLYDEYHGLLDELRRNMNVRVAGRRLNQFKDNVRRVAERGQEALGGERQRLQRQLEQLQKDLQTYENNLGFLSASSKKGNSLVDEMKRRADKIRQEISLVREKIKALAEVKKEAAEAQAEAPVAESEATNTKPEAVEEVAQAPEATQEEASAEEQAEKPAAE